MWGLVLAANLAGTLLAALFCSFTPVLEGSLRHAMLEVSMHSLGHGWFEMLVRGISAGFLIAVLVWLMPSAEGAEFQMTVVLTYLIAIGGFQHIVAGSMEAFMLVLAGDQSVAQMLFGFIMPVLIGNVVGGTALFAVLSYAQVMKEIQPRSAKATRLPLTGRPRKRPFGRQSKLSRLATWGGSQTKSSMLNLRSGICSN